MDNPLKRSFDLDFKEEESDDSEKVDHDTAFDQSQGAASFLNEQSNPFSGDDTADEDEGMDEAVASALRKANGQKEEPEFVNENAEEENVEEEVDRGAVEEVLAHINEDYENPNNETEDRGAVEDVLRDLNSENEYGQNLGDIFEEEDYDEEQGEVPGEQDTGPDEYEDDEEGIDEVVADVLSELNEDDEDPCEEGYTQVGMKTQDGEEVPNCVPDDEVDDAEGYDQQDEALTEDVLLDAVLSEQTKELDQLDRFAEEVLNG